MDIIESYINRAMAIISEAGSAGIDRKELARRLNLSRRKVGTVITMLTRRKLCVVRYHSEAETVYTIKHAPPRYTKGKTKSNGGLPPELAALLENSTVPRRKVEERMPSWGARWNTPGGCKAVDVEGVYTIAI